MYILKKFVIALFVAVMITGVAGCKSKGPMEEAGEKVDKAIEDAKEAVEDAGN